MTTLTNSVHIEASVEAVWAVLADLDALQNYDPGVERSTIVSTAREGIGATRKCDLKPKGWFNEQVVEWTPGSSLAFELTECSLPVQRLRHNYTLTPKEGGTQVEQRMQYDLKMGVVGKLMDNMIVRRKWNAGIHGFLAGLKSTVEQNPHAESNQ